MTANYPGKTVEVNLGTTRFREQELGIMDLPGTYALGSTSEDQWVARHALLDLRPDAVLVVVDATRLERNLYLPLELLDLGYPLVIALNLVDEAWRQGLRVDHARLARLLGVPVVPTVATRGQGLDRLVEVALTQAASGGAGVSHPRYRKDVEEAIGQLADRLVKEGLELPWRLPARAVAILLLEEDDETLEWSRELPEAAAVLAAVREVAAGIVESHDEPAPVRIARERHGLAGQLAAQVKAGCARGDGAGPLLAALDGAHHRPAAPRARPHGRLRRLVRSSEISSPSC